MGGPRAGDAPISLRRDMARRFDSTNEFREVNRQLREALRDCERLLDQARRLVPRSERIGAMPGRSGSDKR
jgi:hypothetical protein